MKTRKIPIITQISLLTFILVFTFHTQQVKANNTININTVYIQPDGSIDPPSAPIQLIENVYTFISNIFEPIVIQRNNTVLDGNGFTLQGNGTGAGFHLQNTENITIRNTKITQFSQGIHLSYSPNSKIINNAITNCTYGILTDRSPETTITNNTINDNKWDGIFITASPRTTLKNNTITNHTKWGIYLGYSADATLKNNQLKDNRYNFGVSVDFIHDIDTTNTVDGKPIYYWINQYNKQVPANAGYVAIINSINIEAKNLNLTKNGQGILIANSAYSMIENSNIATNGYYGIHLINSNYNTIRNNTITNNEGGGIALISSTGNAIINNTIKNNENGIYLKDSNSNAIHHNNIINNTYQTFNEASTNIWDNGYPSGGNYWSDYKGVDADGDEIGDTPYIIDNSNRDNYPLMSAVQKINFNHINNIVPILLIIGIMTAVTVATLAYSIKSKKRHSSSSPK